MQTGKNYIRGVVLAEPDALDSVQIAWTRPAPSSHTNTQSWVRSVEISSPSMAQDGVLFPAQCVRCWGVAQLRNLQAAIDEALKDLPEE